ncbi:hypothetical protein N4G69_45365 [Streptomyces mirabilis]|uniref:hypothetical protein n=1 Tax=Streptomyces mirabilis TaxID=68239 RepID=UPI0021C0C9AB|nr:hypothetical protein [Streptomyces mirabilis]MCT9112711.1 hypothetical protein [Streptomyces mirabilis]
MSASTEEVLARLSTEIPVHVSSTAALVTDTDKAATAIDRQRARKKKDVKEPSSRKPELGPLRGTDRQDLVATPWELLGVFARATTLARQGRGRGLAEHWQGLKYCQALATGPGDRLALTDEGQSPELSYRAMQARELGRAFGLAVAERTVRNRFPDHMISTLDAEAILLAGFARSGPRPSLGARPRPDFFIEAWRPGEPSRVFAVTVNGNHQKATKRTATADRSAFKQLARGSERAEHFHLAEWNTTPCLLMSTELLAPDGITVNALQAPGQGLLPMRPATGRGSADAVLSERNPTYVGAVKVPAVAGRRERIQDGFLIPRKDLGWYGQLLARTGAAGQLAFAGAGTEISRYLTDKQGHKHYKQQTFAGSSSVRDARHKIGPTVYVGTDQVFRLNRVRVEAFSGIAEELYELLVKGEVETYRNRTYDLRDTYPTSTTAPLWGPVSFGDDGTVMALRVLPKKDDGESP